MLKLAIVIVMELTSPKTQEVKGINSYAILPEKVAVPEPKKIKKSKGKGRGNVPYFAKYFK